MKGLLVIGVAVKGDGGFGSCRAVMPYGGTSKQVSKKKEYGLGGCEDITR